MKQVSLSEAGFDDLQSCELNEINGGAFLLPTATIHLMSLTTNIFVAADEFIQGFKEGWDFDKN